MNNTTGLLFTKSHEWVKIEGSKAAIGVTDYAQRSMGDIVFVEFPEIGDEFAQGEVLCTIESVKTVSEIYLPFSGKVTAVNDALADDPGLVNSLPYESWIALLELTGENTADTLMDDVQYKAFCEGAH